jgi:EAL domain-containing protein (putative c-di-GMP-specific phosphodiesterase class I)
VSINLSARDLHSDAVINHLTRSLRANNLDPAQLQVEITESAIMADPNRSRQVLHRIASRGIAVSLDDFGTGYSSLQHLRQLPLTEIKIDRSFVVSMVENPHDRAIVASTLDIARALGLRTVAEGVSTPAIRDALADLGCDLGQGWLFGPAMPAVELWSPDPAARSFS